MSRLGACSLALAAALGGCAGAGPREGAARDVVAEGWADAGGDPAGALESAVLDAKRRAIEMETGVTLRGGTDVRGAVAVQRRLATRFSGTVSSYEVLETERRDGLVRARVRVRVLPGAPPPSGAPEGSAVCVVAAAGTADGAAVLLRRALAERGFAVHESSETAPVVVRADARTERVDEPRLRPMHSSRARLSARAVERSTGLVLFEAEEDAAALGADPAQAAAAASQRAGLALSSRLAEGLAEALWQR